MSQSNERPSIEDPPPEKEKSPAVGPAGDERKTNFGRVSDESSSTRKSQGQQRGANVIRASKRPGNFFQVLKSVARDNRLSFKARGVFMFILSHPDSFQWSAVELAKHAPDGRDAITAALDELKGFGYCQRKKGQNDKGRWGSWLEFFELPATDFPESVKPTTAFPASDNRLLENRLPVNRQSANPSSHITLFQENVSAAGAPATAAADTFRNTNSQEAVRSAPAFLGAGGAAPSAVPSMAEKAAPKIIQPLPDQFTALELKQAQFSDPSLSKLELWQVADLAAAWIKQKRAYSKDLKTQRRSNPTELDWRWFVRELSAFNIWRDALRKMESDLTRAPQAVESVDKRQVPLPITPQRIGREWPLRYAESIVGIPVIREADLEGHDIIVPDTWPDIPAWHRALLAGVYRPGELGFIAPVPSPTKPSPTPKRSREEIDREYRDLQQLNQELIAQRQSKQPATKP